METLEKLFGSAGRVKLMRLFLFHPHRAFDLDTIKKRSRLTKETLRKELNLLEKVGLINATLLSADQNETAPRVSKKGTKKRSTKTSGYQLNTTFPYIDPFRSILINSESLKSGLVKEKLDAIGKMKLVIVAGRFIGESESRLDLFIVGEKIKKKHLETYLSSLEADIGCELLYAVMDQKEFHYRKQVYDRLVRDVLDYPHERIIDRM